MNFRAVEKKLLQDNLSGSSEILNNTIQYNILRLKEKNLNRQAITHLVEFNEKLINRFSSMSKVVYGCRKLSRIIKSYSHKKNNLSEVLRFIDIFSEELRTADAKIIFNCRKLFEQKVAIVTYSNSGVVKKVLAAYRKKIKSVILSEARPAGEGVFMAEYLSGIGIKVNLCVDMLLPQLMTSADYLIVGADRVGPDKFVNKIGTSLLLNKAKQLSMKRFVLCESLKFSRNDPRPNKYDIHPAAEIMDKQVNSNIEIINNYFEIISNRLVSRFITNSTALTPAALGRLIKKI